MGKILDDETLNKYGYNPKDLKPSSCKLVVWECDNCKKIIDKKYRDAKKIKLCLNCSNKINSNTNLDIRSEKLKDWYKSHEHPLKNKERPQHVKDSIRLSKLGKKLPEKQKKDLSLMNAGEGNPFFGRKHTEESLEKMREKAKLNARRGKDSNFYGTIHHGKGQWYIKSDGNKIWMRSSWEIKFAEYLDRNNIKWEYEIKVFPINENENETYTPDFYIIDDDKYIEIKGWWRDDAKIKYEKFIEKYKNIDIEIYDKNKLKTIGIL